MPRTSRAGKRQRVLPHGDQGLAWASRGHGGERLQVAETVTDGGVTVTVTQRLATVLNHADALPERVLKEACEGMRANPGTVAHRLVSLLRGVAMQRGIFVSEGEGDGALTVSSDLRDLLASSESSSAAAPAQRSGEPDEPVESEEARESAALGKLAEWSPKEERRATELLKRSLSSCGHPSDMAHVLQKLRVGSKQHLDSADALRRVLADVVALPTSREDNCVVLVEAVVLRRVLALKGTASRALLQVVDDIAKGRPAACTKGLLLPFLRARLAGDQALGDSALGDPASSRTQTQVICQAIAGVRAADAAQLRSLVDDALRDAERLDAATLLAFQLLLPTKGLEMGPEAMSTLLELLARYCDQLFHAGKLKDQLKDKDHLAKFCSFLFALLTKHGDKLHREKHLPRLNDLLQREALASNFMVRSARKKILLRLALKS